MRRFAAIGCLSIAFLPAFSDWVADGVREPVRAPEWRVGGFLAGDGYVLWTVDGVRVVNAAALSPLVAWYTCDDDAASTVIMDATMNAVHATASVNTDQLAVEGVDGGALRFGSGNLAASSAPIIIDALKSQAWTISMWYKVNTAYHTEIFHVLSDNNGADYAYYLYLNKDVSQCVGFIGSNIWVGVEVPWSVGIWNHLAITRSPSATKLYWNGSVCWEGVPASYPDRTSSFSFGQPLSDGADSSKDDVRVYDVALSAAEVAYLFASYPEPPAPPPVTVTFDPAGGTFPEGTPTSKEVTPFDCYYDLPTPVNGEAYFAGWYADSWEYVDYWTTVTRTTSHTLYAMWY